MPNLSQVLQRLYPSSSEGLTRTLAIHLSRASDWPALAALYEGVQQELDLPAPAISVSGSTGYELWFSLEEPVSLLQANDFLEVLRRRYLAEIPPKHLLLQAAAPTPEVPALVADTGKWSAFIDPSMGAMFVEEPWLEMPPNPEKQADILRGLASIKLPDLLRALEQLRAAPDACDDLRALPPGLPSRRLWIDGKFSDPQSFLLAVMNDPMATPELRVEAAKALLPYFTSPPSQHIR